VFFNVCAILIGIGYLIVLDRDLWRKHQLELSVTKEKEQSESLLKEILPRYVIQQIRGGATTIVQSLSEVTVIFIDLVGFTVCWFSVKWSAGALR